MPEVVIIADTSCLVVLARIQQMDLLCGLYGSVTITPEIAAEFGEALPAWCRVQAVSDEETKRMLAEQVDQGEASALALGLETPGSTLILDDLKARKLAARLNLRFTGTLGVLLRAKQRGLIPSVRDQISHMRAVGFRLDEATATDLVRRAGEVP